MEKGEIARGRDSETQSEVTRGDNSRPVLVLTQVHPCSKQGALQSCTIHLFFPDWNEYFP